MRALPRCSRPALTHPFRTLQGAHRVLFGLGLGLVAFVATGLSGCSSYPAGKQPAFKIDQANASLSSFAPVVEDWRSIGYSLDWVGYPFPSVSARNSVSDIILAGDAVITQEKGSIVSLLEASTGQLRWTNQLATPLTRFVGLAAADGASVIVASSEAEIFTLATSSGSVLTRERLARLGTTRPVMIANQTGAQIVYGSAVGEVVAHRLGLGLKNWGFMGNGPLVASPVQIGDTVGFVSQQGDVIFLDTFEGRLLGRGSIFGELQNKPVADEDTMYVASMDQSVWAFSTSGQTRWRYRTPSPLRNQPTIISDTPGGAVLFLDVPNDGLTALDAQTGTPRWSNTNVGGTVLAIRKGQVVVWEDAASSGTGVPTLSLLDPARGSVIATINTPGLVLVFADKPVDGNLYAVTDSNLVVKFAAR